MQKEKTFFFSCDAIGLGGKLPFASGKYVGGFQHQIGQTLNNLVWIQCWWCFDWEVGLETLRGPVQHEWLYEHCGSNLLIDARINLCSCAKELLRHGEKNEKKRQEKKLINCIPLLCIEKTQIVLLPMLHTLPWNSSSFKLYWPLRANDFLKNHICYLMSFLSH